MDVTAAERQEQERSCEAHRLDYLDGVWDICPDCRMPKRPDDWGW